MMAVLIGEVFTPWPCEEHGNSFISDPLDLQRKQKYVDQFAVRA